jgi:hypothetical protein
MPRRPLRLPLLAAALLLALLVPATAGAEDAVTASLTGARQIATGLEVKGLVDVTLAPVEVAKDATGDGTAPGTDLLNGTIGMPDPDTLEFRITLADPIPTLGGLPDVIHYHWDLVVDGTAVTLQAQSNSLGGSVIDLAPAVGPRFSQQTCTTNATTGQGECTSTPVEGTFDDTGLSWFVPLSSINAGPGSVIRSGEDAINASAGASGLLWYTSGLGGDVMNPKTHTLPTPVVTIGAAATAAEAVADVPVTLTKDGRFTRVLTGAPSTGVAVMTACLGEVCTTATRAY